MHRKPATFPVGEQIQLMLEVLDVRIERDVKPRLRGKAHMLRALSSRSYSSLAQMA